LPKPAGYRSAPARPPPVAARHGRSAEAEQREILGEALREQPEEDPKALLAEMPTVGEDANFARISDQPRSVEL
jgi:plasmid stability protein